MKNPLKTFKKIIVRESSPDPATKGLVKPPHPEVDTIVIKPLKNVAQSGDTTQFRGNMQSVSQQTRVAKGTDPAQSKPEGVWQSEVKDSGQSWPHESAESMKARRKQLIEEGSE